MTEYSTREEQVLYAWGRIATREMRHNGRDLTMEHLQLLGKLHISASFPTATEVAAHPLPVRACEQIGATEAAQRLGITPQAVRKRCAAGTLPAKRIGKAWSIEWQEDPDAPPHRNGVNLIGAEMIEEILR